MSKRFKDAERYSKGSQVRHKEQQRELAAELSVGTEPWIEHGDYAHVKGYVSCQICNPLQVAPSAGSDDIPDDNDHLRSDALRDADGSEPERNEDWWIAACLHIIGCRKDGCVRCKQISEIVYANS